MHARLALLGCAPFAAGRLLGEDGAGLPCPLRAATGLPCPLCGASRAFALVARGDGDWLRQGAVWVLVAGALVVAGLVRRVPRLAWAVPVVAAAWAWALLNRGAIAS